jgi:tetratricopeptide (TPR) repeat protein
LEKWKNDVSFARVSSNPLANAAGESNNGAMRRGSMKKFLIFILVLALVALATIPLWTSKVAEDAFKHPNDPKSSEKVKEALLVKIRIQRFKQARRMAEKAILFFPRAKEMPYFLYNAAKCAELEGEYNVAIYWYKKFVRRYPKHIWTQQAKNALNKLVNLHQAPK